MLDVLAKPSISDRETLHVRGVVDLIVRPVVEADALRIQDYIRGLSAKSRYSRMLGAASELPPGELDRVLHGDFDHPSLLVTAMIDGREQIVAEARLAHDADADTVEISLSVDDRWQKQGVGRALFDHLQDRAARFGVVDLFGDTLRSNEAMIGLARKSGFALIPTPGDWRLVRFHKRIDGALPLPVLHGERVGVRGERPAHSELASIPCPAPHPEISLRFISDLSP